MSHRAAAWLAWSLWALCGGFVVLAVLLDFYTPPIPTRQGPNFQVLAGLPLLVYPTVGAFVVSHRPKNPIGWILCGMGILFGGHAFAEAYTSYARFAHLESLPSGQATMLLAGWWLYPAVVGAMLLGAFALGPVAEQLGEPWAVFMLLIIGLSGIPVAVGIAILKYLLYDIDVIINRTLVYGSLTALLAAVYFGGVTALRVSSERSPAKRSSLSSP